MTVYREIKAERTRQHARFGQQDWQDGTGEFLQPLAERAKRACERATKAGTVTWLHILEEEVAEAFAEENPVKLRAELIQIAAVALQWVEAIDRRPK